MILRAAAGIRLAGRTGLHGRPRLCEGRCRGARASRIIRDLVLGITPGDPLISLAVAVNILAGITGSASGGMSIALQKLGATCPELGRAAGIHPELLHRVTAIATGGLDSLPDNGAVITLAIARTCLGVAKDAGPLGEADIGGHATLVCW